MSDAERGHDMNRLAAFLEGRLDGAEREAMVSHLAGCAECRETEATFVKTGGLEGAAPRRSEDVVTPRLASRWLPLAAVLAVGTVTALMVVRRPPEGPAPPTASSAVPGPASAAPRVLPPSPAARPSARDAGIAPGLLARRGGATRTVAGKTFYLVAGEWVDAAYDPAAALPAKDVAGAAGRAAVLDKSPGLRRYAALGDGVTVVFEGTVYRFHP